MSEVDGDVTLLLARVRDGNQEAANQLIPLIYRELRQMAGAYMRGERPGHTLQATALVNEAYMRMVGGHPVEWQSRAHFFAIAAHTMREVLLDYALPDHAIAA
jgi:RNA polymerase sigma-70 factor (ECF subfamily)